MTNEKINYINPISKAENLLDSSVKITGGFEEIRDDGKKIHQGVDYRASEGTPIYAAADGVVINAGHTDSGYGNFIIVKHSNGESTLYAHLEYKPSGLIGSQVEQGQEIAKSGNTGIGSGPHLHFEIIGKDGTNNIEKYGSASSIGIVGSFDRQNPSDRDSNSTPDLASAKESLTTTLSTITVTAQKEAVAKSWFETFSDSLGLWTGSVTNFIKEVANDVVNFFSSPSESLSKIGGWISSAFTFGESEKTPDPSIINNSNLNLEINTDLTSGFAGNNDLTQTGNVIGDADWRAIMPINIINGDGYKNVASSGIVSDGFRPGNSELSSYSNFNTQLNVDFSRLDNLTNQLNQANQSQSIPDISKLNLQLQNPLAQITNNAIKSKLIIFFTLLMCIATDSYADRCWLIGGCENKIVYVYVPPTQYDDQNYKEYSCFTWLKVFEQKGLPEVGSIIEPHHNDIGWYYGLNDIKSKYHEVEKLFNYEEDRKERECLRFAEILSSDSPSWGGDMKVKILSYTKSEKGFFAQIKILTSK